MKSQYTDEKSGIMDFITLCHVLSILGPYMAPVTVVSEYFIVFNVFILNTPVREGSAVISMVQLENRGTD